VGGNSGQAAFRLPPSARPSRVLFLPIYAAGGSAGGLSIKPSGRAFLFDATGGGNVTKWASMDGVSFRAP